MKIHEHKPSWHRPVPMGTRVIVFNKPSFGFTPKRGSVVGVASVGLAFSYIIQLDEPMESPYGTISAITMLGTHLEGEDGESWDIQL